MSAATVIASVPPPALTVTELDRHGVRSHEVYRAGFYDSDWDYVVRSLLGKAVRGGAAATLMPLPREAFDTVPGQVGIAACGFGQNLSGC